MTRTLILLGAALAAVAWLARQPAFTHDSPHKQAGALIAITIPFLAADIILAIRKKRRLRAGSPQPRGRTGAKVRAGRW